MKNKIIDTQTKYGFITINKFGLPHILKSEPKKIGVPLKPFTVTQLRAEESQFINSFCE